jgi:hypothetical protein
MVKKIKKKTQKGPKATVAVPMLIAMTALYGSRRQGKDFRHLFSAPKTIQNALQLHFDQRLMVADRPLSLEEYLAWGFRSKPAKLAEMFGDSGVIPIGPAVDQDDLDENPRLTVFPIVALVQDKALQIFSAKLGEELSEVSQVTFQNAIFPALGLIPGYDLLLYRPPAPARGLNHAIESLNILMKEAFEQASVPFPGPFDLCPEPLLADIPLKEPCFR